MNLRPKLKLNWAQYNWIFVNIGLLCVYISCLNCAYIFSWTDDGTLLFSKEFVTTLLIVYKIRPQLRIFHCFHKWENLEVRVSHTHACVQLDLTTTLIQSFSTKIEISCSIIHIYHVHVYHAANIIRMRQCKKKEKNGNFNEMPRNLKD